MKKRIFMKIGLLLLILCLSAALVSCEDHEQAVGSGTKTEAETETETPETAEVGLIFDLNGDDRSYSVTGLGQTDGTVDIPETYNDLPVTIISAKAFFERTDVISVSIPDSVTRIGRSAFRGCTSLTRVTTGTGLTVIDQDAFRGCTSLAEITIGEGLTTLGSDAFHSCLSLTDIVVPESVTEIGRDVFAGCSGLVSMTLPFVGLDRAPVFGTSMKTMLGSVFGTTPYGGSFETAQFYLIYYYYRNGDVGLNSIVSHFYIPKTLRSVTITGGKVFPGAFVNCGGLTDITLTENVTIVLPPTNVISGSGQGSIFGGCNALQHLALPSVTTDIGTLFTGGSSGTLKIPDSLTSLTVCGGTLKGPAFSNWGNLKTLTVGKGVQSISGQFPAHIETLVIEDLEAWLKLAETGGLGATLPKIDTLYIGDQVVKTLTVPAGVKCIGNYAFAGLPLQRVILPDSVTTIGKGAFRCCSSLREVYLPDSVTKVDEITFERCTALATIRLPANLRSIGSQAFYGCTALTVVDLPESIESIGSQAFSECTALTAVDLPESIESIGSQAFSECTALSRFTLPQRRIPAFGRDVFRGCSALQYKAYQNGFYLGNAENPWLLFVSPSSTRVSTLKIHADTVMIASNACHGCNMLTEVTFEGGSLVCCAGAFEACSALQAVRVADLASWCGIWFQNETANPLYYAHHLYVGDTRVIDPIIPDGVRSIWPYAFIGCTDLGEVTFGPDVQSIEISAFSGCTCLYKIVVGSNLTFIGQDAFSGCTVLTNIRYSDTKQAWRAIQKITGWDANTGNYIVHCTDGNLTKYSTA